MFALHRSTATKLSMQVAYPRNRMKLLRFPHPTHPPAQVTWLSKPFTQRRQEWQWCARSGFSRWQWGHQRGRPLILGVRVGRGRRRGEGGEVEGEGAEEERGAWRGDVTGDTAGDLLHANPPSSSSLVLCLPPLAADSTSCGGFLLKLRRGVSTTSDPAPVRLRVREGSSSGGENKEEEEEAERGEERTEGGENASDACLPCPSSPSAKSAGRRMNCSSRSTKDTPWRR
jgi:hypothetical protein